MKKIISIALSGILSMSMFAAKPKQKEINILNFGHSFSADAITYVPEIAETMGVSNLNIGLFYRANCPLQSHYECLTGGKAPKYGYSVSGFGDTQWHKVKTDPLEQVSSIKWDYIVLQTSLEDEGRYETIEPWITKMIDEIIRIQKEKFGSEPVICWHLFWPISKHLEKSKSEKHAYRMSFYDHSSDKMWEAYKTTAKKIMETTKVSVVIPTGAVVTDLRQSELCTPELKYFTRDGYHMSYVHGRYIAALAYYQTLLAPITGKSVKGNKFVPSNENGSMSKSEAKAYTKAVMDCLKTFYL